MLCSLTEILTRVWNLGLTLTLSLSLMSLCSDLFFTFYPPSVCAPILVRNPPAFHLNCFSISERTSPLLVFSLHIHFNLIPRDALNTLSYGRKIYLFSHVTEGTFYCTDIPPSSLTAIVLCFTSVCLWPSSPHFRGDLGLSAVSRTSSFPRSRGTLGDSSKFSYNILHLEL